MKRENELPEGNGQNTEKPAQERKIRRPRIPGRAPRRQTALVKEDIKAAPKEEKSARRRTVAKATPAKNGRTSLKPQREVIGEITEQARPVRGAVRRRSQPQPKDSGNRVKIIPLGGLEQIGMNITAIEYDDSIVIVDCGLAFPEDDMLGIDLVIPED